MSVDVITILEQLAETGHAPEEGCSLFGVGYEDAFERLKKVYLQGAFSKGRSVEKFVVGLFGSGKTHFLRHLMEIARGLDCVTAEVALNKDLDFTKPLLVYQGVAQEVRTPDGMRGIAGLLEACLTRIQSKCLDDPDKARRLAEHWVAAIGSGDFKEPTFARIARQALEARLAGEMPRFDLHCRWLSGEISNRGLAREVETSPLSQAEHARFGHAAMLSLCQLVRHAQFTGTVICFDEAEQGFSVDRQRFNRILSMLQSSINATTSLSKGSALIVYAITPDIAEEMRQFPALQQRIADPGPQRGFFNGNTRAPTIDLTKREDPQRELETIGRSLVHLLYDSAGENIDLPREDVLTRIDNVAREIAENDAAVSNRRTMVKRVAEMLVQLEETGSLDLTPRDSLEEDEPEV
ncbi:hypothetical protein NKDENANG_00779 [Candidatus Entotheonellaceae bacterium PAL068K]